MRHGSKHGRGSSELVQGSGSDASRADLTIGHAIRFEFELTLGYAVLIIVFADRTGSFAGVALHHWIMLTAPVAEMILFSLPDPPGWTARRLAAGGVDAVMMYRHILAFCLLAAGMCLLTTQRSWSVRASQLSMAMDRAQMNPDLVPGTVRFRYRLMVLGAVGSILLLLVLDFHSFDQTGLFYEASWTFLRAPLLVAGATLFVCHAIALRRNAGLA